MSFVFYDTETTGTDTSFDQILQFGAIRTDEKLNEIERFEIRCRILPHVVPAPGAMNVTGISAKQLTDPSIPSHYQMACLIRAKLTEWSPSLFIGYNSIKFDEVLVRQLFYQNLHPLYLTNRNGNSRLDAMYITQATTIFAPDLLTVPVGAKGKNSFKLDNIAPANGHDHKKAHDAMSDVEATIHMCKLISTKAPNLWASFMRFREKTAALDFVHTEAIYSLSDFYFNKPYSWLVTTIGINPENGSEVFAYDISVDPDSLINLSDSDLAKRLEKTPKPIRSFKINRCPIIVPASEAPSISTAAGIDANELKRRSDFLRSNQDFCDRLLKLALERREDFDPSPHVEGQIYEGFYSADDEKRLELFHTLPWEKRSDLLNEMEDKRLKLLGNRLICREQPSLASEDMLSEYNAFIVERTMSDNPKPIHMPLSQALAELDHLLETIEDSKRTFVQEHRDYIKERLQKAVSISKKNASSSQKTA